MNETQEGPEHVLELNLNGVKYVTHDYDDTSSWAIACEKCKKQIGVYPCNPPDCIEAIACCHDCDEWYLPQMPAAFYEQALKQ